VSEDLFPSGPWVGFYNYGPGDRHRMDLHLTFANGIVSGDGNDDVGRFLIRGHYDAANRECQWTKTYPGSHDVSYRGFREGKGIWGTWEIGLLGHGGFHIWPKGAEEGEMKAAAAEASAPLDAVAVQPDVKAPVPVPGGPEGSEPAVSASPDAEPRGCGTGRRTPAAS
jgi:hypothetical protein